MKIAMVGYGQMGRMIKECAQAKGDIELVTIDPVAPDADFKCLDATAVAGCAVCIDFTTPAAFQENFATYAQLQQNVVIGTTGWDDRLDEFSQLVSKWGIGIVYSANFSIGVNLFFRMVEEAAKIINRFDDYDIFLHEVHHKLKLDSPSGTAKAIADIVLKQVDRKSSVVTDRLDRRIGPAELHLSSVRGGSVPGTHVVSFDSSVDTITMTHTARSREGFARGALVAAAWIAGKKGVYTKEDMISALLAGEPG